MHYFLHCQKFPYFLHSNITLLTFALQRALSSTVFTVYTVIGIIFFFCHMYHTQLTFTLQRVLISSSPVSKEHVIWWISSVLLFPAAGPSPRSSSLMTYTPTAITTNSRLGEELLFLISGALIMYVFFHIS